jgi:KDO2-lipid IV(A) lauroyltransferase
MGVIGFYLFYAVNWIITLLPLRVLYIFSDLLFVILYYIPSYRRKVVSLNLKNSFPEKSAEELATTEKKFYRHLADVFIETLKLTHLSNKQLLRRFIFTNPELLERLYKEGRDLVIVHSHYNNWEWLAPCLPLYTNYNNVSIYKPLRNILFDRFLNNLRSKNNMKLAPMSGIVREIIKNRKKNIISLYGFIADQTPAKPDIKYWTNFLNHETPVYLGPERIAVKYDMTIVFFNVQKVNRGHYSLTAELMFERTSGQPQYLITETHVKRLEELIKGKPEFWMWSHRRWKHKKPAPDV